MNSLEDAWRWYQDTRTLVQVTRRLATHYWDELPWEGRLGRDDHLRLLESGDLDARAGFSLAYIDDLAVIVLFFVFEGLVRERVQREVEDEARTLRHAALQLAAREMIDQTSASTRLY
jgi:hypothetical protein